MGEYADDAVDREINGEGGGWFGRDRAEVRCAFCRERDLFWKEKPRNPGKYYLADGEGKPHTCLRDQNVIDDFEDLGDAE